MKKQKALPVDLSPFLFPLLRLSCALILPCYKSARVLEHAMTETQFQCHSFHLGQRAKGRSWVCAFKQA